MLVSAETLYSNTGQCIIKRGDHHSLFEVDSESYDLFCATAGWRQPPPFLPCQPIKQGRREQENIPPRQSVHSRLGSRQGTRQAREPATTERSRRTCTRQESAPSWGTYKIPRKAPTTTLSQEERSSLLQRYLGEADPVQNQRRRLNTKIRYLKQNQENNQQQREELAQMIATTADPADRQALKEEVREMDRIIRNQEYAIKGLQGQLKEL